MARVHATSFFLLSFFLAAIDGGRHSPAMSRLGSSTTTPIRAITSSLSARSSAPVPAASQTYEPLLRAVLRHRLLYGIFLSSAIFEWAQTMLWIGWWRGIGITQLPFLPFLPSTLAFTAFAWALGVVPVVVLRKARLTGEFELWSGDWIRCAPYCCTSTGFAYIYPPSPPPIIDISAH